MKLSKRYINLCFIPFICILPMFGILSCTADEALDTAEMTFNTVGDHLSDFPANFEQAAPMMQEDLESVWYGVTGSIEICAEDVGISEPPHPLRQAQEARDVLIAGGSFTEVISNAYQQLTTEDLENIPVGDLCALNGILPFDIDLSSCGENLAEVLNSLDVGQVSAILESDAGYHLIQMIDRDGGQVRIGHIVFEVNPVNIDEETVEESYEMVSSDNSDTDALTEAQNRLAQAIENQHQ